ncbi:MAG: hypothetical protein ACK559_00535 [bacterium]
MTLGARVLDRYALVEEGYLEDEQTRGANERLALDHVEHRVAGEGDLDDVVLLGDPLAGEAAAVDLVAGETLVGGE